MNIWHILYKFNLNFQASWKDTGKKKWLSEIFILKFPKTNKKTITVERSYEY